MSPKNNFYQGAICSRLLAAMVNFNETQRLGAVLDSSTGFWMRNRNCRAPDISFITKARLRAAGFKRQTTRFFPGAPDLAVEILPQIMCAPKWTSGSRTSSPAAPKSPRSSIPPMSVSKSAIRPRNGS